MKNIFIIVLVLNMSLLASVQKAQGYYDAGEYEKSIKELKNSKDEYSNPGLHVLWAKSAEALGRVDEAMSAYERVLMFENDNVEARIALANIYRDTKRNLLATNMRKSLQKYQLSEKQKSAIKLSENKNFHSFKASASLSTGHDTNINVNPGTEVLDDYFGNTGNKGEISTLFTRLTSNISYINDLKERGGWYTRSDLRVYYQNNLDESYYNLFIGTIEAGGGFMGNNYSIYLPISYDRVNYLEKDLLYQISFAPKANISLSDKFILNLNTIFTKRTYTQDIDKTRDDTTLGVGFGLYYLFEKNLIYLHTKYENFSSMQSEYAKFVNKDLITASMGVKYNVADLFVSTIDYRVRYGIYEDNIGSLANPDSSKRSDTYQQAEVKLAHNYTDSIELYISDRYAKNSSNYLPSEYNKNIVMLGLSLKY